MSTELQQRRRVILPNHDVDHRKLVAARQRAGFTRPIDVIRNVPELGLTRGLLSHYENGRRKPPLRTLLNMLAVYNTQLEAVITGESEREKILSP